MLIKVKKEIETKTKTPIEIEKTVDQIKRAQENWREYIKENKEAFNGKIIVITDYIIEEEKIILEVALSFYEDLIYAKKYDDLKIWPYFSVILLKTLDEFYVVIKNNKDMLDLVGGMVREEDFEKENPLPEKTLERTLKEEFGLFLKNKEEIVSFSPQYIKLAEKDEKMCPCSIIYMGNLNYTKDELIKQYEKYQKESGKKIKELLFYNKSTYKSLELEEKRVPYLIEVLENVINEA